jgi:cobalt-zinc-cadmium efflux system protein
MKPHNNTGAEQRLGLSLALTGVIFLAEAIGGVWTGSLALLSDAAHVFMDIFALGLSYLALRLSALPPDDRHTYGYHRLEVLAALANGLTLGVIAIGIFAEAYQRWQRPEPVKSGPMLVIAVVGLVVNLIVAYVLGGHTQTHTHEDGSVHHDVNVHSAFLHVLGDAISSVGVIVAAILIGLTDQQWIDPFTSVVIGLIIVASSWRVLHGSLHILIEGVPEGVSLNKVGEAMSSVPDVTEVHDLHVWSICSGHTALSAHVVVCEEAQLNTSPVMDELKHRLCDRFNIEHTTIQFEVANCGQGDVVCVNSTATGVKIDSAG